MQRPVLLVLSCALTLTFTACDKGKTEAKKDAKADAEKDAGKAEGGEAKAEGGEAKAEGGEAKSAEGTEPAPVEDDTMGLATLIRSVAADTTAPAPAEFTPYDTSKDAGGLIGHLSSGLSHDEALAASKTAAELAKLAGEEPGGPTDAAICEHAWGILAKAYPDKGETKDDFGKKCKVEVERERVKLGVEIFAQHSACVLAAAELAALDKCDAAEDAAEKDLHQNPHGDRPEQKDCVAAVEHFYILVTRDMTDNPDLLEVLEEDIEEVKTDSVMVCGDEATKAEITCVMKAAKLVDLEGCK